MNIVQVLGVCSKPETPICIVTEYLPGGSLYDLIHNPNFELTDEIIIRMAIDIASGMSHLHVC